MNNNKENNITINGVMYKPTVLQRTSDMTECKCLYCDFKMKSHCNACHVFAFDLDNDEVVTLDIVLKKLIINS